MLSLAGKTMTNSKSLQVSRWFFYHPIARILLGTVILLLGTFLIKELITKPVLTILLPHSNGLEKVFGALISTGVLVGIYYFIQKYYEHNDFHDFDKRQAISQSSIGFGIGFSMISIAVLVMYLMGFYKVVGSNNFIQVLPTLSLVLGGVVLEELIFRGLMFSILEKWKGTTIALIGSSVIFQLPHFMNPHEGLLPAILGVLFGLTTAVMYKASGKLWLPIAFHYGWNIAQPILGTTLSGIEDFNVFFITEINGPSLITGSAFGVEDSLVALLSLISLIIIYLLHIRKKNTWVKYPKNK